MPESVPAIGDRVLYDGEEWVIAAPIYHHVGVPDEDNDFRLVSPGVDLFSDSTSLTWIYVNASKVVLLEEPVVKTAPLPDVKDLPVGYAFEVYEFVRTNLPVPPRPGSDTR